MREPRELSEATARGYNSNCQQQQHGEAVCSLLWRGSYRSIEEVISRIGFRRTVTHAAERGVTPTLVSKLELIQSRLWNEGSQHIRISLNENEKRLLQRQRLTEFMIHQINVKDFTSHIDFVRILHARTNKTWFFKSDDISSSLWTSSFPYCLNV